MVFPPFFRRFSYPVGEQAPSKSATSIVIFYKESSSLSVFCLSVPTLDSTPDSRCFFCNLRTFKTAETLSRCELTILQFFSRRALSFYVFSHRPSSSGFPLCAFRSFDPFKAPPSPTPARSRALELMTGFFIARHPFQILAPSLSSVDPSSGGGFSWHLGLPPQTILFTIPFFFQTPHFAWFMPFEDPFAHAQMPCALCCPNSSASTLFVVCCFCLDAGQQRAPGLSPGFAPLPCKSFLLFSRNQRSFESLVPSPPPDFRLFLLSSAPMTPSLRFQRLSDEGSPNVTFPRFLSLLVFSQKGFFPPCFAFFFLVIPFLL